nr:IS66 family transposase [Limnoglobus roseus]
MAVARTLYDVERRIGEAGLRGEAVTAYRRDHARPVLDRFATWLAEQKRVARPSGLFGQAVTSAVNQWPTLVRYVDDHHLAIDNGPGRAGHPPAGRRAKELAVRRRRQRPVIRGRPAHRGGERQAARARPVGLPPRPADPSPDPTARRRDVADLLPDRWRPS